MATVEHTVGQSEAPTKASVTNRREKSDRLASEFDRNYARQLVADYLAFVHERDDVGGDPKRRIDGDALAGELTAFAATGTFDPRKLQPIMRKARVLGKFQSAKARGESVESFKERMMEHESISSGTIDSILYRPREK